MTEEIDYITRYEEFLKSYKTEEGETPYNDAIARLSLEKHISISIDFNHLLMFDPELATATKENPQRAIDAASAAIRRILRVVDSDYSETIENLHARFKEVTDRVSVRFIRSEHIGQLIMVDALVTRVSDVKPLLVLGMFQCRQCQEIIEVQQGNQFIAPPICTNDACRSKGPFDLIPERSKFVDWQKIRLQEKPEELPPGALPRALDCILQDDLVDIARPGDPCRVVGILRSTQDTTARTRRKAPTFSVFLATNYVAVSEREADRVEIEPKEEEKIRELAKDPLVHRKIVNSIAPSIYGLTDIKEAVCLLLFGGVSKVLADGVKIRGDSNILLVGDPGTAKSVHGSEQIYVGIQENDGIQWATESIGSFVDKLMKDLPDEIIENNNTDVLPLPDSKSIFTQAMDPYSLKIQKSRIYEVSRHQTSTLIKISTRSGRTVLATPDHSFTTISGGQLKVLEANNLRTGVYLPVARKTSIESATKAIDLASAFPENELVRTNIISSQIEQIQLGEISARQAATISKITPNTMDSIIHGTISLPEESWQRRKYDTSWFPEAIKLDNSTGRIIGFYLAEGNVEGTSIRFSNLDKLINNSIAQDLKSTFGKASIFNQGVLLCQSSLAKWFKDKFGSGAEEKEIPNQLLSTPYSFRCALLSGYFSGDGTIDSNGTAISATTVSKNLAYQVSDLLATLGIFATIKERTVTKGPYTSRIYYQIRIQSEDIIQFSKHVTLVSESKQRALEDLVAALQRRRRYQRRDIIPNFGPLLNDAYKELGIRSQRGTWTRAFLGELRGKTQRQRVGRKYLQKLITQLSSYKSSQTHSPTLSWLHTLAHSEIFWDPITHIEEINQPTTVYDIATTDGHFVLAHGNLIVHNSQLLKYVAQLAPRGLYTSGKGSTAAGLCVGPDSRLVLSSGINSINDVVESHFEEQTPVNYDAGIQFVENGQSELQVFHSKNLQMELGPIDKLWKIKSPDLMVRIRSRTGKTLELTPKTSILSLDESLGLVWKQASQLRIGDRVATSRTFPVTGLKSVPLVSTILKGYSKPIRIWNIEPRVRALISQLKIRFNLSVRKIAKRLGINEDTLYRWMNKERLGNIPFDKLLQLCQMLDEKIEDQLPDYFEVQAKYGQSIILPKKLSPEWFYILGLLFGDGRVFKDKRKNSYGGTTIGLSNNENELIDSFSQFIEKLGLNPSLSEKSEKRPQEIRVFSSVIYHILSYFGLPHSPKSNKLTPNADILYFNHMYLSNFIKGLYDADGWIFTRSNGSSHIGLSSISKPLIEFVQIALLSKNIQSFIRRRDSVRTVLNSGHTIEGRYPRYSLIISNHSDIKWFAEHFGFNHPQKQKKLLSHCQLNKTPHSNLDNIPHVSSFLWKLLDFYDHKVFQLHGQTIRLTPSRFRRSISSSALSSILDQLQLNWRNHRISVPFQQRNQLFQELQTYFSPEELMKISGLSKSQIYEYFIRNNRTPTIPIGILHTLLTSAPLPLSKAVQTYWTNQITAVLTEHQTHKELYTLLKSLSKSDIYWDEITSVTHIPPPYPYVYDLTIPGTHNFVVNTFVVHNTAAVLRDPDTEGFALEAGALVLADRGTACLHPRARILLDNELMAIEEAYATANAVEAISNGEVVMVGEINAIVPSITSSLDVIECRSNYIRKRDYSGFLVKISTETGFQTIVTPDHMFLDGTSLDWKIAQNLQEGDCLVAPLQLPRHNNSIQIFDIIPDSWIVCLNQTEKKELRVALLDEFGSLANINRFFGLRRDVFSGRSQMKIESLQKILLHLNLLEKWKKRKLSYGRKQSGERLKVTEISPEMAYFMGFVFGDGWNRTNNRRSSLNIRQSLVNQEQIQRVLESYSTFSKRSLRNYPSKTESKIRGTTVRSQSLILTANSNLLTHIYDYLTQNNLSNLQKLPDQSLSAFIAGIMDADGCISIKRDYRGDSEYHTVHVDIQCSNSWLENQTLLLALRRFDCYGRLKPDTEIIHIQITARTDVEALLSAIRPYSVKVKPLPKVLRTFSSLSDKIPSKPVASLANQISKRNTSMLVEKGIWSTIYSYKHQRYPPSRGQLQKIQSLLINQLTSSEHETINNLLKRDYFLDPIISIEKIPYKGPVYDLYVPKTHNYLADGLITHNCIDEFDKMRPQDRTAIHEAMEQHTVSIAKAGIVATLNARTAILAAANPNLGRYVPERSFAENVNLPVTLLSRFDLIFTLTDLPEAERDERTAEHIIALHKQRGQTKDPPISADLLRKFIAYARRSITPVLTDEALNVLKDFYLGMRKSGERENAPVPITARQLESLIRLTEAHAKMALREKVLAEDAQAAVRLVQVSLQQVGFDSETGQYDIDNIMIGRAKSQRDKLQAILTMIRELEKETPGGVPIEKLEERAELDGISATFVRQAVIQLRDKDGLIFEPRPGRLKYIKGA